MLFFPINDNPWMKRCRIIYLLFIHVFHQKSLSGSKFVYKYEEGKIESKYLSKTQDLVVGLKIKYNKTQSSPITQTNLSINNMA